MALPDLSGLTVAELAAVLADVTARLDAERDLRRSNEQATRALASAGVDELIATIGPPLPAQPGDGSLHAIVSTASADINADPARYIKALAGLLEVYARAGVAGLRIASGRHESTSTGN